MVYGRGLWISDKQKEFLRIMAILAIINISLNLILIPSLGPIGAAIATVLTELVGLPLQFMEFAKVIRIPFHRYIARPLFASIMMVPFGYCVSTWAHMNIFVVIFGGVIIYVGVLLLVKGVTMEELGIIQSTLLLNRRKGG
jgi:O-antigen/teichoic acid export membrane protein